MINLVVESFELNKFEKEKFHIIPIVLGLRSSRI